MKNTFLLLLASLSFSFISSLDADAQTVTPHVNGFTIGRSNGISSNFLQISRSESNVLIDILTKNVSGNGTGIDRIVPDSSYEMVNDLRSFSIVQNKNTNNSGESETVINNSAFSGFNHSIFLD